MKQAIVYVVDKLTEQTCLFALTANGNLKKTVHVVMDTGKVLSTSFYIN